MRIGAQIIGGGLALALLAGACGDDDTAEAPSVEEARVAFCEASSEYVAALDQYGRLFEDAGVTVGDVRTDGEALTAGRAEVEAAAEDLRAAIAAAEEAEETVDPELEVAVSAEAIERLETSEERFADTLASVADDTPLDQAVIEVSSAAYELQISWLIVLAQAGCVEDLENVIPQIVEYVAALQTDLQTAGFYDGPIDGIYGPETVAAVKALQEQAGLPVTGLMDRASQAALAELLAGQSASQVKALQGLLTGLGYWSGPIDGVWTDELGVALARLQSDLGLEPTGTIDIATLIAIQEALAAGMVGSETTTTTTATSTTATTVPGSSSSTTAPAPTTPPAPPTTAPPQGSGTVVDVLAADGRFTTLLAAVEAAGLADDLAAAENLTVFAPTDEAFAAAPQDQLDALLADPDALGDLLLGHVVLGARLSSDYLAVVESVITGADRPIAIEVDGADLVLDGSARVVEADIEADNGLIHAIDAVLVG
ncbi:MAG: fasciclin domain-containing protein [Acidimicrobiales bacterium]|nr:fasciclin domain-containing protein [Acidimicrobiales bacterium]